MAADKEIMRKIETLRLDRPGRVIGAALDAKELIGAQVTAVLRELAATYREEAELWAKSGAKGWKGSEAENYLIAQAIDTVPAQLDNAGGGAALSVSEPREPVVQTEAATTHERLDALVSAAVTEGRGMLRIGGEDVTAYLKGDVDTLPGLADALVPNSITTLAELRERQAANGTPNDDVTGDDRRTAILAGFGDDTITPEQLQGLADAGIDTSGIDTGAGPMTLKTSTAGNLATLPDFSATMTILGPAENGVVPVTWESDTMTADGLRKPGLAPTLGQPGDNSGGGYSHDYVPPGGRKLTYADLLQPVPAAILPPHLSHSQGNTIGDCAAKYRMQRVEQLPQIPQWANIGGTATHACYEAIERMMIANPALSLDGIDVELVWKHHFDATIAAVAATSTVPRSVWRSSRKGAEGEAWWWVNGPKFLRAYLDARPSDVTWAPVGEPAIELDRTVDVHTPYGPIPFNAKIDRVTISEDGRTLTIRDYKTSYERPTDTTQLGDYAWVLAFADPGMMAAGIKILGSYFDARRGTWTEPVAVLDVHPFEAFQYRVTTAHAQKRALTTGPTPARPSSFCGGCSVRYACPVMALKA